MADSTNEQSPSGTSRAALAAVCILVCLGFALRIWGVRQSLDGDELFTWNAVNGRPLANVIDRVSNGYEANPPLFHVLAWLSWKVGGAFSWVRLPSLAAGTALIPSVWLLGRRAAGEATGVVAAAMVALGASWIFYANEARAYALMALLVCLSSLALIGATRSSRVLPWALCVLLSASAIYTHYTAAVAVIVQFAWAIAMFPRTRVKALCASLLTVIAFIPWLPNVGNRSDAYMRFAFGEFRFGGSTLLEPLRAIIGLPDTSFSQVPGVVATAAFLLALGVGLAAAVTGAGRARLPRSAAEAIRSPLCLLALIAVAVPSALVALGAIRDIELISIRNLSSALPAIVVLAAAALTSPRWRFGWAVPLVAVGAVFAGGAIALSPRWQRPDAAALTSLIERSSKPSDVVLFADRADSVSLRRLDIYLEGGPRPWFATASAWQRALRAAQASDSRVFVVVSPGGVDRQVGWDRSLRSLAAPPTSVAGRLRVVMRRSFSGRGGGLELTEYEPLLPQRPN